MRMYLVLIVIISFFISSCSTIVPHEQILNIVTSEPDAKVWVNGNYEGVSPLQVKARRNNPVSIMVKKDGYEPAMRSIGKHINVTGILDIIGTIIILVPVVGLITPGAWTLDETNIYINLLESSST